MRSLTKQRGMSPFAWIAILLVVGFFAYFGSKVIPAYFEYYSVVDVVEGVRNDRSLQDAPPGELRATLRKRLRLNDVDDRQDGITLKPRGGGYLFVIDYEVRKSFIGNIDICMHFKRRYEP